MPFYALLYALRTLRALRDPMPFDALQRLGFAIASLPTGQGLVVKPQGA